MKKAQSPINHHTQGFSLIETLFALALLAVIVPAFIGAMIFGTQSTSGAGAYARALLLADEGLEAARSIRDANVSNLTNGTHGIAISEDTWVFSGISDTTDMFTRKITVSNGGANRKIIASHVSWQKNPQQEKTVILTTQLANWQDASDGGESLDSCDAYAQQEGYTKGVCRKNAAACEKKNEIYLSGGDSYCTGGSSEDTCCAKP